MKPLGIVIVDEVFDPSFELFDVFVFLDINLLVFECSKESLNNDIVDASTFTVHSDSNPMILEYLDILFARILAALV